MLPSQRTLLTALTTAALTAAAVTAASLTGADAKSVSQTYSVPGSRILTVSGHGFGHGHGLSQYGARGAARQGLSWKRILAFYYPGTTLATTTDEIRVLVSSDTTPDVVVDPAAGLTVRDVTTGAAYPLPTGPAITRWRLMPRGATNAVAWYDGSWHRWRVFTGDAELFADGPLTLRTPSGLRTYRGALRAAAPTPGSAERDTVNVLSIDDYVRGVVPAEMPASWERAAVRAQAVAARTYAAWSRATRADASWQICDSTACQVYRGVAAEDARATAAVVATAGRVLTFDGKPAFTQFSSSSGGWTSAGSVPYLVSRQDPYEATSGNPYTDWSTKIRAATIQRRYPAIGRLLRIRVTSREGAGDWQGRVWSLTLVGSKKSRVVTGDAFRSAFGLRSTYFTFGR